MPPTYQVKDRNHDPDQSPAWITLASMFVGQRLDKWAAIGAYAAAVGTLTASILVLLFVY